MKFSLLLVALVAVASSMLTMVFAETVQPVMFSDCDNSTADIAAEALDYYADNLFHAMNPSSGFVDPGYPVEGRNINSYSYHFRERALETDAMSGQGRDLLKFSTCPRSCNAHPGIPVCRALNCRTGGGRRLWEQREIADSNQYFTTDDLLAHMNIRAGQLAITLGCQVSVYIMNVE